MCGSALTCDSPTGTRAADAGNPSANNFATATVCDLYLLAYQDLAPDNLSVSVSGVHRRETIEGAELVMDLKLTRATPTSDPIRVPVTFVIGGARSTVDLELTGNQLVRNGHTIPDRSRIQTRLGASRAAARRQLVGQRL